ncbi:MAG: hypothetical protein KAS05_00525 [Candidatus Omnitrophica bacterium]|nr:hypothetical protein [Candidatus Omnitrophota bacterium]
MNKKLVLCFIFVLFLPTLVFAETIILSGTQTKQGQFFSSKLESDPINIPRAGKIVKIEGEHKGFWINKKNDYRVEKTYRFPDYSKAKGETLSPGTYTVYPNLPREESKARVKVYIELEDSQSEPTNDVSLNSGTIAIYGTQEVNSDSVGSAKLKSKVVELSSVGEIVKVKGGSKGFWVNEVGFFEEDRVYRCWDPKKAIGVKLEKGKYKVFPNIPDGDRKADVTIYVKVSGGAPEKQNSDSSTFYRSYCKVYVPNQSAMYKNTDKETYEAMKSAGALFSNVDDCIKKSIKTEQEYYSRCLDEGKTNSQCDQVVEELKEMYRQMSTREGCTNMYKAFCGFYNLEGMGGVPEDYKLEQDKLYQDCIASVDNSCQAYPRTISW